MDMDMDGHGGIDYSDFEYQIIIHEHNHDGSEDNNPNTTVQSAIEPLGDRAGLDNNEVAELVYFELEASLEFEQANADQDVGSSSEFRGAFGANIPADVDAMPNPDRAGTEPTTVVESKRSTGNVDAFSLTADNYFGIWDIQGSPSFDDEANGLGGGEGVGYTLKERNYRQLTGRGPVLDANDDITILSRLVGEDTVLPEQGNIRLHLVWDVSTVDDAGRAFSVPSDD